MATNQFFIAAVNPVKFYWTDRPVDPAKNFFLLGEDWFSKQIPEWYQKIPYLQKWQQTDTINLQVKSNFDPIAWQVRKCDGKTIVKNADFEKKYTAVIGQPYNYYEANIQLADIEEGEYEIVIIVGSGDNTMTWVSEPQSIALKHSDTLIFNYKSTFNDQDVIFDTGIEFFFRCEGFINTYDPQNNAKTFDDQYLNMVPLSATASDNFKLNIGGSYGVPNWVAKLINTFYCCNYVLTEGLQFVRPSGTKMEATRAERYPMTGWLMDIVPASNYGSDFADSSFNNKVAVTYNIDASLFGTTNDDPANNTIRITQIR
jgi:hypothetical protein